MSYEGYEQWICENGHYQTGSDRYHLTVEPKCHFCSAAIVWGNPIDDTNCDSYGEIPMELLNKFRVSEEVVETCNMGHPHIVKHAVYRIPSDKETEEMRHYRPEYGNSPLVPLPKANQS